MSAAADGPKLEILICHARADAGFASELTEGLKYGGTCTVMAVDPSISEGEDSKPARGDLIAAADVIVLVLSPAVAMSPIFQWEATYARELSKMVLPVRLQHFEGIEAIAPGSAAHVPFDDEHSFMESLKALVNRLPTDIGWLQDHTALSMRTRQWQLANRSEDYLLNSEEAAGAKNWTVARPNWAPKPSSQHLEFIAASEALHQPPAMAAVTTTAATDLPADSEVSPSAEVELLKKANRFYAVIAVLLAVVAGLAAWQVWLQQNKAAEVQIQIKAQEQNAELSKVTLAIQKERIEDAIKTVNASLCTSVTRVADLLATTSEPAAWDTNFDLFWTLYEGPMIALEQLHSTISEKDRSLVADAMLAFGKNVGARGEPYEARAAGLPRPNLLEHAAGITTACEKANATPSE